MTRYRILLVRLPLWRCLDWEAILVLTLALGTVIGLAAIGASTAAIAASEAFVVAVLGIWIKMRGTSGLAGTGTAPPVGA
ncbi:hypothetical protein [Tsukamurella pseudospumae]|uniref:Uncharacterized protein n=2 Tax=Tsukamurella pseudospumae TaxID=239498 RepID=A0A138AFM6_9ACTN|nr:hypothetical protein [Tsukamurella pseudospumae]KXP09286.1 hypothetical protein AXK60_25045 [Tsukamurella pseudospumae]